MNDRKALNNIYTPLHGKKIALTEALSKVGCSVRGGFYNGHYHKNESGEYVPDVYPIPVLSVDGICDIEIDIDSVSVSTKLAREAALAYDMSKLIPYPFEAYGVEEYTRDLYTNGMTLDELVRNILGCAEREIGFSFYLGRDVTPEELCRLVLWLGGEGFYY